MTASAIGLLRRVSMRSRLIAMVAILLASLLGASAYLLAALHDATSVIVDAGPRIQSMETSYKAAAAFADLRYWVTEEAVRPSPLAKSKIADAREALGREIRDLASGDPELAARLRAESDAFERLAAQASAAERAGRPDDAAQYLSQLREHGETADTLLEGTEQELSGTEAINLADAAQAASSVARHTLAWLLTFIVVVWLLATLVLRSILSPLKPLHAALMAVGNGDLATPLPPPAPDELGAMTHALVLFREGIGERRALRQEAEAQRVRLADAISSINEGFVLFDAADTMVMCNPKFIEMQPDLADIMVPGVRFRDILLAAAQRGQVNIGEHTPAEWVATRLARHQRNGSVVEVRFGARWVQVSERPTADGGWVAIYTDITDLKHREQALEAAREEAVHASQVKSEFLANMSHELRTPLNAIIGYSQLLQEDAGDAGQDDLLPDLQKIESAGKHLLGLINDILDLSKIEAGRMDLFVEAVDVAGLVEDVRLMVEPLAARNGNRLAIDCPPGIGAIRSDVTKLKQSLLNLLGNACKFTEAGTVALAVRAEAGGRMSFAVTDTGIGMTEEQMGRLFQAFVQADNSTTRRFGGTGLGLAITRSFAHLLGGDVTVTSKPGEGSTFRLELPVDLSMPAPEAQPAPLAARGEADQAAVDVEAPSILVIDDDPPSRRIIGAHLAREGWRVAYAASGSEGLEKARAAPPDAITLDIMMPQMDGWSVLSTLKSDPLLRHVPVVLVTIVADRALAFSLGAAAALGKPVDRAELIQAVRQQLTATGEGTVLVVEDDPPTRELTERTVASLGHEVALAANGREALTWLAAHPAPALIVLDLLMPEMDGLEFLTRLRAEPEWQHIPVIVVTAKQMDEAERARLAAMTSEVVAKGHSGYRELARAVREALPANGRSLAGAALS